MKYWNDMGGVQYKAEESCVKHELVSFFGISRGRVTVCLDKCAS